MLIVVIFSFTESINLLRHLHYGADPQQVSFGIYMLPYLTFFSSSNRASGFGDVIVSNCRS